MSGSRLGVSNLIIELIGMNLTALSFLLGLHKKDILTSIFKKIIILYKNMNKLVSFFLENYIQYVSCQENL